MRNVSLFVEDSGHEEFLKALVKRLADEYELELDIKPYSVRRGHGKVITELRQYRRDLQRGREPLPDLIIVGTDGNCKRFLERRKEVDGAIADFRDWVICAIPEPHVERWLLVDSAAFRAVLGKGCALPDQKCDKDRYKHLLLEAIRSAGIRPLFGGIEHAADLVGAMNLQRAEQADNSLGRLLKALHRKFNEWKQGDF